MSPNKLLGMRAPSCNRLGALAADPCSSSGLGVGTARAAPAAPSSLAALRTGRGGRPSLFRLRARPLSVGVGTGVGASGASALAAAGNSSSAPSPSLPFSLAKRGQRQQRAGLAVARASAAEGFLKELQELQREHHVEGGSGGGSGARAASSVASAATKGFGGTSASASDSDGGTTGGVPDFEPPLNVLLYPDPKLRAENATVTAFDANLEKLARSMFDTMYATDGIGLAAPQVGMNVRVMVFNPVGEREAKDEELVLVNPRVVNRSKGQTVFEEGCLSFPNILGDVRRSKEVVIEAQDLEGQKFRLTLDGLPARIFLHEFDHLQGTLFHDRMAPKVLKEVKAELVALEKQFESENPGVAYQSV